MIGMFRFVLSLLLLACGVCGQTAPDWKKLDFLIGNWTGVAGEKDTQIGAGQGDFSFTYDVDRRIIVRRNNAKYESGARHEDLMVIYFEDAKPRAIYWDSEGHVIRYSVALAENRAVFETEANAPGPSYRLTYWIESGNLKGRFEVGGKVYLAWSSRRK